MPLCERSVKRLEGVTRSPVFSQLSASLNGLTSIRAFKAEDIMINDFDHYQDVHSTAYFSTIGLLNFYFFQVSDNFDVINKGHSRIIAAPIEIG